jgi:hypothetical protein
MISIQTRGDKWARDFRGSRMIRRTFHRCPVESRLCLR